MNNNCCNYRTNYCRQNIIPIPGPIGPAGTNATIAVGSTITSPPGANATVTNSGTTSNAVLNFTIPRGEPGTSATINIGTTTSLPPGSTPTVTNSGTTTNAILNFEIPTTTTTLSGNFISRVETTYSTPNNTIALPTTVNETGISINSNNIITIPKSGRYLISYGIQSTTTGNIIGLYINGINNTNTNLETTQNNLSPSSTIILNLNTNSILNLGTINATTTNPLTLQNNTINAYLTITSLN